MGHVRVPVIACMLCNVHLNDLLSSLASQILDGSNCVEDTHAAEHHPTR